MKLLLCARCNETFSLAKEYKECRGGHGGGQYIDNLNAKVWGDPALIFVLGFANSSLVKAIRDQINYGDQEPSYLAGYGMTSKGRDFTAFVIPNSADSVDRQLEKFEPVEQKDAT